MSDVQLELKLAGESYLADPSLITLYNNQNKLLTVINECTCFHNKVNSELY